MLLLRVLGVDRPTNRLRLVSRSPILGRFLLALAKVAVQVLFRLALHSKAFSSSNRRRGVFSVTRNAATVCDILSDLLWAL